MTTSSFEGKKTLLKLPWYISVLNTQKKGGIILNDQCNELHRRNYMLMVVNCSSSITIILRGLKALGPYIWPWCLFGLAFKCWKTCFVFKIKFVSKIDNTCKFSAQYYDKIKILNIDDW